MFRPAASSLYPRIAGLQRYGISTTRAFSSKPRVVANTDPETGICHVVLNRPEKLNGYDWDMFQAVAKTVKELRDDKSIKAVILRGDGRAFCTGLDVMSFLKSGNPVTPAKTLLSRPSGFGKEGNEIGNLAQDVCYLWREIPVPVIAAVHGMCFGAGLQMALGCDYRITTPDCKWAVLEIKWGLIPDMGAAVFLRELIGIDKAKELTFTGRMFSGEEAGEMGIATKVCEDPVKEAEKLALELVQKDTTAIQAGKKLYQNSWRASEKHCLELESDLQIGLFKKNPAFNPPSNN